MMPNYYGVQDELAMLIASMGAIAASHPFEVARVLIVNNGSGMAAQTLKDLVATKGVAGLFAGLIPRSLAMAPAMLALQYATRE